jgi:thiosulfate dehydrogenase [quinone] large subunit
MTHDNCPCQSLDTDVHRRATKFSSADERGTLVARRNVLLGGAGALALLIFDRVPGSGTPAALARTLQSKFHPPAGSRKVGNLSRLPADSALATTDPQSGQPALILRLSGTKKLKAYSAVCTHAGCTVRYDSGQKLLVCPCHGSVFDPAHGAAVLSGPAPSPLTALKVAVDQKGHIWLV